MQAQFLDEKHLLLALGPPDASALRHAESQQQAAFLAVYSLQVAPQTRSSTAETALLSAAAT